MSFQEYVKKNLKNKPALNTLTKVDALLEKNQDLTELDDQGIPLAFSILKAYPEKTKEVALNLIFHHKTTRGWTHLVSKREELWSLVFKQLSQSEDWETLKAVFTHFKESYYEFTGQVTLRKTWSNLVQEIPLESQLQVCKLSSVMFDFEDEVLWIVRQVECFYSALLNYKENDFQKAEKLALDYQDYWVNLKTWPDALAIGIVIIEAWQKNPKIQPLTLTQKVVCSSLVQAISSEKSMLDFVQKDPVLCECLPELILKEKWATSFSSSLNCVKSKRI